MNLNLRDPDPVSTETKKRKEMSTKQLEVKLAKINIERTKWEKMSDEQISIVMCVKWIGIVLIALMLTVTMCQVGSSATSALNPITTAQTLLRLESKIDSLSSIKVPTTAQQPVKDSVVAEKKIEIKSED